MRRHRRELLPGAAAVAGVILSGLMVTGLAAATAKGAARAEAAAVVTVNVQPHVSMEATPRAHGERAAVVDLRVSANAGHVTVATVEQAGGAVATMPAAQAAASQDGPVAVSVIWQSSDANPTPDGSREVWVRVVALVMP